METLCHIDGLLSRHGIHHQQDLMGLDTRLDIPKLLHELLIDLQTARRIDDDHIVGMGHGIRNRFPGDGHRIGSLLHGEDGNPKLLAEHLKLLDGRRTIDVRCHQQRPLPLFLEGKPQLSCRCGLACALQSHHHDDSRGLRAHIEAALGAAHEFRQFLIDNLHHNLGGGQGFQYLLSNGPFFDGLDEILDDLEIHIGLKKRHPHFPHGLVDIVLRQLAMSAQFLEGLLQAFR